MRNFSLLVALPLLFATEDQIKNVAEMTDKSKGYRLDEEVNDGVTPFTAVMRASLKAREMFEPELEAALDDVLRAYSSKVSVEIGINMSLYDVINFKMSDHFECRTFDEFVSEIDTACEQSGIDTLSSLIKKDEELSKKYNALLDMNIYANGHLTIVFTLLSESPEENQMIDVIIGNIPDSKAWMMMTRMLIDRIK